MKLLLIAFFTLISVVLFSQDTLVVYFDFGSAKVKKEYHSELRSIGSDYDLTLMDSVQFIGYADSIGKLQANSILSLKRAENVYKYCREIFENLSTYSWNPKVSFLARGEEVKTNEALNRRVEIIFYYKQEEPVKAEISVKDPRCFEIDYETLEHCHVTIVQDKKREMVRIETQNSGVSNTTKLYYVKRDAQGQVTVQKVKWKLEQTGRLWWRQKRYTTSIPKASFDQFRIFKLHNAPCIGCKEDIFPKDTTILVDSGYTPDHFLRENMQLKLRLFRKNTIEIRVPKEYVDLSINYYYSQHPYGASEEPLNWELRDRKKEKDYYFTELPLDGYTIPYITKKGLWAECPSTPYDSRHRMTCGNCCGGGGFEFRLNLEPGVFYHNDTTTNYLTFGLSLLHNKSYAAVQAGLNTYLGFYGTVKYAYYLNFFDLNAFSPKKSWKSVSRSTIVFPYGGFYVGAELKTSYHKSYMSFLEGNTHFGFSLMSVNYTRFFSRAYIQSGIAKDFSNRINPSAYGFVQLGITFTLNSKYR